MIKKRAKKRKKKSVDRKRVAYGQNHEKRYTIDRIREAQGDLTETQQQLADMQQGIQDTLDHLERLKLRLTEGVKKS